MESKIRHKTRNRLTDIEKRLVIAKGDGWGRMDSECGVNTCKLLCVGWINNNKVLLYSTGNYIHYPKRNTSKEHKKECINMYN